MTESKKLRLSEGFAIAILTLAGYALAFFYEFGSMHRYGLPGYLIRVDITYIVLSLGVVAAAVMLASNVAWLVPARPWAFLLLLLYWPTLSIWLAVTIFGHTKWVLGPHLIFPMIFGGAFLFLGVYGILIDVVAPIYARRDLPTIWDRWRARVQRSLANDKPAVLDAIEAADPSGGLVMFRLGLLAVAVVCTGVYSYGKSYSSRAQDFIVASRSPACIVVRRYAENLVCVDIDSAAHRVLGGVHLLPLGDTGLVLTPRHLGVLRTASDSAESAYWFAPPAPIGRRAPPAKAPQSPPATTN